MECNWYLIMYEQKTKFQLDLSAIERKTLGRLEKTNMHTLTQTRTAMLKAMPG